MGKSLPGGGSSPAALGHQKTAPQWKNINAPVSAIPTQKLGGGSPAENVTRRLTGA